MDEVKLKILPGGDMGDAVRVLFGQLSQHLQLGCIQSSERDFDALHARSVPEGVRTLRRGGGIFEDARGAAIVPLAVVIPLAVGSPPKPGLGEDTVLDFALFLESQFVFEDV